ncbi:MAG: ATPase domain-containing protein [Sedimenticola sp.]
MTKLQLLRDFWRSRESEGGVTKLESGIRGFDELLEGGVPEGRTTLVSAGPGCGKTVLLAEYVYRGVEEFDQPGIFLTFEERPRDIIRNLTNFGWDLEKHTASGKLIFIDASLPEEGEFVYGRGDWLEPMLARIRYAVEKSGAKRLSVDNLGAVFLRYEGSDDLKLTRERLYRFADRIKELGLTTLVSSERADSIASLSHYSVEEFVSDGLIQLDVQSGTGSDVRTMWVRKMRGCGYRSGKVVFDINHDGIEIYPKIPVNTSVGDTEFSTREGFGIPALDRALGGGIPQGHIMLVAGNTGTGKSTLAMHFVKEGVDNGQPTVWVALEEPVKQVLKTANAHGWDLESSVQNGSLGFVTTPMFDISADKLLYKTIDAVNQNGARRIVVDSISSLESASMHKESVREFMMQLAGFAKTQGITVILNYLSGDAFGASKEQLLGSMTTNAMRLSSIVDAIILLRYVERDQGVQKLINILKLRGSHHVKDILRYEINQDGFSLGERFGVSD